MGKFPFKVSLADMFRKMAGNYVNPVDYVSGFVGKLAAEPGNKITIDINPDDIRISSASTLDEMVISEIISGNPTAISRFVPPGDYNEVKLASGNKGIEFSREIGKFEERQLQKPIEGTRVLIGRDNKKGEKGNSKGSWEIRADRERLNRIYDGSNLEIELNGELIGKLGKGYDFSREGFSGRIGYDRFSKGGLHFYQDGRKIDSERLLDCIDLRLYEHGIPATITLSGIIKKGNDRYGKLKDALPEILADMLGSEYASCLREESEASYQNLLRKVAFGFKDNSKLLEILAENVRFEGKGGKGHNLYSLKEIKSVREVSDSLDNSERELYRLLTGEELPKPEQKAPRKRLPTWLLVPTVAAFAAGYVFANPAQFHDAYSQNQAMAVQMEQGQADIDDISNYAYGGMSRQELAQTILLGQKGGNASKGYVLEDISNYVEMIDGVPTWTDKAPANKLESDITVHIPKELIKYINEPDSKKIAEVARYVRENFEYDVIDEPLARYDSMIDAMLQEKKAICSTANTYAALILDRMGVDDILYATGTYAGVPHAWLIEIDKNGKPNRIIDATPKNVNGELLNLLMESGVGLGISGLNPLDLYASLSYGVGSPSLDDQVRMIAKNPIGSTISTLNLGGKLAVYAGAVSLLGVTGKGAYELVKYAAGDKRRKRTLSHLGGMDELSEEAKGYRIAEDLLGYSIQKAEGEKGMFDRKGMTIYIPREDIDLKNPLFMAINAGDYLPGKERQEVLERILDAAK